MPKNDEWIEADITLAVDGYFKLFVRDLSGIPISKNKTYKQLVEASGRRNSKEFEQKFCDISKCLLLKGFDFINGLEPGENFQFKLIMHIDEYLAQNTETTALIQGGYQLARKKKRIRERKSSRKKKRIREKKSARKILKKKSARKIPKKKSARKIPKKKSVRKIPKKKSVRKIPKKKSVRKFTKPQMKKIRKTNKYSRFGLKPFPQVLPDSSKLYEELQKLGKNPNKAKLDKAMKKIQSHKGQGVLNFREKISIEQFFKSKKKKPNIRGGLRATTSHPHGIKKFGKGKSKGRLHSPDESR